MRKILIIFGLLVFVLGVWAISPRPHIDHVHAAVKDIYYCPMHPSYTSDRPGDCPICNMKLVKKEKATEQTTPQSSAGVPGYATISVLPKRQQLIGLTTTLISRKNAIKTIRASGNVATNHELYVLQDEYIKATTEYVTTYRDSRRLQHGRRNWEPRREKQLRLHEIEDQLLRLGLDQRAIEKLQKVSWRATWDQPELLFFKDEFAYWVTAQIFENDLGYVEVGQEAELEISGYREKAKGVIRLIGGTINSETRTAYALIELKGYRGELKGNMFVNVSILAQLGEVIAVPRDAVMDTGVRKVVFVQKGEGIFEPRVIETGWTIDGGYEVTSGLVVGEKVVTSGNFLLDSESRIQSGLAAGEHKHGQ